MGGWGGDFEGAETSVQRIHERGEYDGANWERGCGEKALEVDEPVYGEFGWCVCQTGGRIHDGEEWSREVRAGPEGGHFGW
jgi:hypothetical protein